MGKNWPSKRWGRLSGKHCTVVTLQRYGYCNSKDLCLCVMCELVTCAEKELSFNVDAFFSSNDNNNNINRESHLINTLNTHIFHIIR